MKERGTNDFVRYNLEVETPLWEKFKACLRKVYWQEGCDINEGIKKLIKKFVEENGQK